MLKGKDYDWQDSNLALFGSDLERNVKKAAAETEQAWHGCGQAVGQEIWRIEKFKVVGWKKEHHGSFYSGDSYIILNTYKEEEELKYDLHFWIGRHSSQDEYGTAAYKTVELDTFLDDKPVQHREVHGFESDLFKTYFPAMQIWKGGVDSGFRHVKPEEYEPRLLHFSGTRKNIVVKEVELLKANVHSDDVFILDLGLTIYQFNGKTSNKDERMKANQFVTELKGKRGKAKSEVLDEADTSKNHEFWKALGDGERTSSKADDSDVVGFTPVLFRLSDASGSLEMTKVAEGQKFEKPLLDTNDVFLLDTGHQMFVWVGKGASKDERAKGMQYGHNYAMKTKHPFVPIARIGEGQHVPAFDSMFA
ncbi:gelsolin-like protein 1 [Sycon ciliatum]|uniref:gelsolin-like protein 1 n=1 Tax=Sycon ciliatum TaxID=27933 RepID=UPI0020A85662|eukprot:scpid80512/ scgid6267/ Gelsolin-like protein 2; Actin-modulator